MTQPPDEPHPPQMNVQLHKAEPSDMQVVQNLVGYYIYDLSEYMGWPCTPEGHFVGCAPWLTFWSQEGKHAFMLRSDTEIAGFALVDGSQKNQEMDYLMAEFFVLRKFRRKGVGETIANQLFALFPGNWVVSQLVKNTPAVAFWRKVIGCYTNGVFVEKTDSTQWGEINVILFNNTESIKADRTVIKVA